ncbi:hypothetical protein GCM10011352_29990 [Marinobacterium zhoushanense]|uniref:Threonine/homoserine/homoserine lactone efflux protein n=1 Tax=Marinobacterium zhoushanense TaxID=1679163 RepID=A0ABQ1KKY5_9GAMM|nr:LysE family translocator [Marinobacterium zhoushanense]GGC01830.1 hypothetical protein GCM10011352_29990 [Marinobacterium zhoushanense]
MSLHLLLIFIPACFALNLSPGPNNLLAMSNAQRYGLRNAVLAGAGRLIAFALMIVLAASGLAVVLHTSELIFTLIKVVGALYLFWMAYKLWIAGVTPEEVALDAKRKSLLGMARQEFLLASGNPKAILIFTAFLPQFVDPAGDMAVQFAIVGALFLLLEWVAIALYGAAGLYLKQWFSRPRGQRIFNRSCALLLAGAGGGLLASQR